MRSIGGRLFWALTWGVGVAVGVALGGWLTVVGGAGAPGLEALDTVEDLFVLPAVSGIAVACVHFVGSGVIGLSRLVGHSPDEPRGEDHDAEQPEDDGVDGHVG